MTRISFEISGLFKMRLYRLAIRTWLVKITNNNNNNKKMVKRIKVSKTQALQVYVKKDTIKTFKPTSFYHCRAPPKRSETMQSHINSCWDSNH